MVNLGPSLGSHTCKQRRVKCDEARPSCKRCVDGGFDCGGCGKASINIRIKDQTKIVRQRGLRRATGAHLLDSRPRKQPFTGPTSLLSEDQENAALCFFLCNFATTGRDFNSSRGFFECIAPSLAGVSADSAVALSASAVAIAIHGGGEGFRQTNCIRSASVRPGRCIAVI